MYRPLPSMLTIRQSGIEGLGLFATQWIEKSTNLGMCHFYWGEQLMRTPLGGFINHSEDPNCDKVRKDSRYFLVAIRDIHVDEELTLKYTFYEV